MTQEGVTDLAGRRTQTDLQGPAAVEKWGARLLARFPWLDAERETGRPRPAVLYTETGSFFKSGDRWMTGREGPRNSMDPLWIVEALAHADESVARGGDVVRGAPCRRWEFRVDPALHPEIYGSSQRRPLRLAGDAWIDDDGRLRRVTWTRLRRRRPRWPKKIARPAPQDWQTTELWDFGLPVEIDLPSIEPERSRPRRCGLVRLAWELWRRKRAYYERRRSADEPDIRPL